MILLSCHFSFCSSKRRVRSIQAWSSGNQRISRSLWIILPHEKIKRDQATLYFLNHFRTRGWSRGPCCTTHLRYKMIQPPTKSLQSENISSLHIPSRQIYVTVLCKATSFWLHSQPHSCYPLRMTKRWSKP